MSKVLALWTLVNILYSILTWKIYVQMLSPFNELLNLNHSSLSFIILLSLLMLFSPSFTTKISQVSEKVVWMALFFLIATLNLSGLVPYAWSWSAYPVLSLTLALTLWISVSLSSLFYGSMKWSNRSQSHYLPLSTPLFLWLILPVIEIISQLIRPLTLTVRLSANLIAGHILIFLVSRLGVWSFFGLIILITFEIMVALVQSVVFVMLINSYSLER